MNMQKIKKTVLFAPWSALNKNYHAYQMWHSVFHRMFFKVIDFDPQKELYLRGKDEMNKMFIHLITEKKPDFLFIWLIYDEFYLETLATIKLVSPNTKIINFCGDDDMCFENYTRLLFPFIDYFFSTQADYFKYYNTKPVFFAAGVDTKEFKPLKLEKKYDVGFIGTPKWDRPEILTYLKEQGIKVAIFSHGSGWERYPELKECYLGKPPSDRFSLQFINQCKINLCLSKNYEKKPHLLERFFQISACNSFCVVDYCKAYKKFLKENKEIVFFRTKEELLTKIKYFLVHKEQRATIAKRAYRKTLASFSNEKLVRKMFEKISNTHYKSNTFLFPKRKIIILPKDYLLFDLKKFKEKSERYDYIVFGDEKNSLPYRSELQIYAMELFKKDISCCNAYYTSRLIGNYLSISMRSSLRTLSKKDFKSIFFIEQLVFSKEYLVNNWNVIRKKLLMRNFVLNEKKVAFVNFPLVKINALYALDKNKIGNLVVPLSDDYLRTIYLNKDYFSIYFYKFLLFQLFCGAPYRAYTFEKFLSFFSSLTKKAS